MILGVGLLLFVSLVGTAAVFALMKPSNEGPWKPEYERLATADIKGDVIVIQNFRRTRYSQEAAPVSLDWTERTVRLSDLQNVWFGLSVFQEPGLAHTFLSFDFGDGDPIVVSVESRQRPGQKYSPLRGLLHQYHLIYTVADEKDILGVRTYSKSNEIYFQPLVLSEERMRALFLDMFGRLNDLAERPRFYNTLTSNCTTSLLTDTAVPKWQRLLDWRLLLPGFSDRVAWEYGILDTRFPVADLRLAAHLGPSDLDPEDKDFSKHVRASFWQRLEATD